MIKTISLSLVAISLLLVSIVAIAEPPNFDQNYYYPPPSQNAPRSGFCWCDHSLLGSVDV